MPKLILDRRTMTIIRAPRTANAKPTPAKPLPDGYSATLKAVPVSLTPTPSPQYAEDIPALDEHGKLKMTYRLC